MQSQECHTCSLKWYSQDTSSLPRLLLVRTEAGFLSSIKHHIWESPGRREEVESKANRAWIGRGNVMGIIEKGWGSVH